MKFIRQFLALEWKAFKRSPAFETNIVIKILMGFVALYFMAVFTGMGIVMYYGIKEKLEVDPLPIISRYAIYYLALDLLVRYQIQKMPVTHIKQLVLTPFTKRQIVRFSLLKSSFSFFNIIHLFLLIPLSVVLMINDYEHLGVLSWSLSLFTIVLMSCYLNVVANSNDKVLSVAVVLFFSLVAAHYFEVFNITDYTFPVIYGFYTHPWSYLVVLLLFFGVRNSTIRFFIKRMFLDTGLALKHDKVKRIELSWLNRFGIFGAILTNDVRMIYRNKRPKQALLAGVLFLFYGLLFYTNSIETYQSPAFQIFGGIFVTGGFLFIFGNYVPSWDSSYYPLLMSQNISYLDYLKSKWALIVFGVIISTLIASFYLLISFEVYLYVLAAGFFNAGLNVYFTLLSGAFVKTPIDLTQGKKAFGDAQSLNLKTFLLVLPKLILPIGIYLLGYYTLGHYFGIALLMGFSVLGMIFHNKIMKLLVIVYQREKYDTLKSFKK